MSESCEPPVHTEFAYGLGNRAVLKVIRN